MALKIKTIKLGCCSLGLVLLSCLFATVGQANSQGDSAEKVFVYLIDNVAKSQLTFIRNGTEYSSQEAADHIRKKYEYFKSRIESIDDFIQMCASKSLMSGEPYLVSTAHGKILLEKWLREILNEYGERHHPL